MSTQAKLGDSLLKNLINQRQQKGELSIEDVGSILQQVASDFHGATETDAFLRSEITKMAEYIDQAKMEIAEMMSEHSDGEKPTANVSVQLDAVVKATEQASNEIMNVADAVQALAAGVGGEKEQKLMNEAMKLYEACSFQDLTGQRINKVISIVNYMDDKLHKLTALFSKADMDMASAKKTSATVIQGQFDERDLLNGPQLNQPTQADIDALFDDFKPQ